MASEAEIWSLIQQHGGLVSDPVALDPQIDNPDPQRKEFQPKLPNPNPTYRYIMRDGTSMEVRGMTADDGTVNFQVTNPGTGVKPPTATSQGPTDRFSYTVHNTDGSQTVYQVGKNPQTGKYDVISDLPPQEIPAPKSTTKTPSAPSGWSVIRENPADPNSRAIALLDPVTGDRQAITADARPDKPQLVQGQNGEIMSWDGTSLVQLRPPTNAKPADGTTDTRVIQGMNVSGVYQGGEFVPKQILGPATPGAPVEGATRPNIQQGYRTTQTYSGGDWTTTDIGSKAIPTPPTAVSTPVGQPTLTFMDDQGRLTTQNNPAFMPKTPAEIAARVGQIQSTMQAKGADIQKRVDNKEITADQGISEFNSWYSQSVAPSIEQLNAAQRDAAFQQGKDAATLRQNALTTALAAGSQARENYTAANAGRVGPGWEAANAAASRGDFKALGEIPNATTFQAPDLNQTAQDAVMQALKFLSPTAAQATGTQTPDYQGIDIANALAPSRYVPGGGVGLTPAPQPTLAPQPASSLPGFDQWFNDWQSRQAADAAQQVQARAIPGVPIVPATEDQWQQFMPNFQYG